MPQTLAGGGHVSSSREGDSGSVGIGGVLSSGMPRRGPTSASESSGSRRSSGTPRRACAGPGAATRGPSGTPFRTGIGRFGGSPEATWRLFWDAVPHWYRSIRGVPGGDSDERGLRARKSARARARGGVIFGVPGDVCGSDLPFGAGWEHPYSTISVFGRRSGGIIVLHSFLPLLSSPPYFPSAQTAPSPAGA